MALLAEARREADSARAAKMRAIEGMMPRGETSSGQTGGLGGLKAASAAAALGVAPEDGDREDATTVASLGAVDDVARAKFSTGMRRAKAGVGVGVGAACVAAFGVVAVVAAVTRRSAGAPGGSDAERIPLVTGRKDHAAGGGATVEVDVAQLATGDSQSWQSRAATRWGRRRANGDAGDDWADVV